MKVYPGIAQQLAFCVRLCTSIASLILSFHSATLLWKVERLLASCSLSSASQPRWLVKFGFLRNSAAEEMSDWQ